MEDSVLLKSMSIFPKLIHKPQSESQKFFFFSPEVFFTEMDNLILKFIQKNRGPRTAQTPLRQKNSWDSRSHATDPETGYKPAILKTVWYWHKQTNRRGQGQQQQAPT